MKLEKKYIETLINTLQNINKDLNDGDFYDFSEKNLIIEENDNFKLPKKLPNKWSVKITDSNRDIFAEIREDGSNSGIRSSHIISKNGFISNYNDHKGYYSSQIITGYLEIDFEEYKECFQERLKESRKWR